MNPRISVIIPNYNGGATIGACLAAAFSSRHNSFEVIVVDDCSTDNSVEIAGNFPCRLILLDSHAGASAARNRGAAVSRGEVLFFIDADCVLLENTLAVVDKAMAGDEDIVLGGTYTSVPFDPGFFSAFQSVFINYSETKRREPDYIASHAMAIGRKVFEESGGFPENFLPILEDVEFSHRARRSGRRLIMNPEILVRHIFNFDLSRSLRNAYRKSKYWVRYSAKNRDLLSDSGTASLELKTNVASFFLGIGSVLVYSVSGRPAALVPVPVMLCANLLVSRNLLAAFLEAQGMSFAIRAALYYSLVYPLAVGAGALAGVAEYCLHREERG